MAAARTGLDKNVIIDALIERERLGTTGIGYGVALPHTRLAKLKKIFCAFARTELVDFESVDAKPVDLIFLLLVPEDAGADHLKALAKLSRLLRNEPAVLALRQGKTAKELYNTIVKYDAED